MNCLDLVPALKRHLKHFIDKNDTDSVLAGYISDAIKALGMRWDRTYAITFTAPATYEVSPSITAADEHVVILMASVIYKGSLQLGNIRDGDFAQDIPSGYNDPIARDLAELKTLLPPIQLAKTISAPMRGFDNWYNPESYKWLGYLL